MSNDPPVGPTVFTLMAMHRAVQKLRTALADPDLTADQLLEAMEEANRWTLAVETLLSDEQLQRIKDLD